MIASLSCKIPSDVYTDRLRTSFTEQFLTSSKFKLVMGSGRGIISTPQAQILLAYFRGIPVETVLLDEPAVRLLQGKSTRLLRALLSNAETDLIIEHILTGDSSPSPADKEPRVPTIDNAKRESDSISWAEDDDDDDGDDDYALVTWGYMSFSDGDNDDSGDFSTDDDFNEDCVFSIPSSVGMLTPRLSSSHSASVSLSPASRPGSQPRSRPGLSPASHSTPTNIRNITLTLPPDPTRLQKMLGRRPLAEELSQTSVLLYTPNGTPPPPDCNIAPELCIHAAMNTPRS